METVTDVTPEWWLIFALLLALVALLVIYNRHIVAEKDEWRRIAKGYHVAAAPMLQTIAGDAPPPPSAGVARRLYLRSLKHMLSTGLSMNELNALISDMGLQPDDIPGETISDRARQLVDYADRRRIVGEMVQVLKDTRPDLFNRDEASRVITA